MCVSQKIQTLLILHSDQKFSMQPLTIAAQPKSSVSFYEKLSIYVSVRVSDQNPEGESIYQVNKLSYQTLSLVVGIFKVNAIRMGVPRNLKKSPTH